MNTENLLNKFIFIEREKDCFQSGEIVGMACPHLYMVKLDPDDVRCPPVSILIAVDDMISDNICYLFNSRAELTAWTDWIEKDDRPTPKIVEMKRVEH